ncbi:hypothetical protein [Spiroplasma sp. DGKH1]|uniref:hypothetical protein n=1 Tax=Spiroplasma sp. DGKH1 TaxID=3050074 RepID=UPI0034C5E962
MRNADINFLCRSCTQELKNKLKIIREIRTEFLKNLIFLEIKDKSLVELKEEYDIKIVLYLRCANRHFGLFVKSTLFDKKGTYKNIVLENVINNEQPVISRNDSYLTLPDENFNESGIVAISSDSLTSPSLNEANMNFIKNMDHKINQLGVMHLHNMKHMSKMRRNFLIVLLVLIVLAAAGLAGGLGFYFTISKEVTSAVSQQNFNRVDLSEDVKNLELGSIVDNKDITILAKVKALNDKIIIDDILLKDISKTRATLVAKSSSSHYNYNSTVSVEYLANKITLKTDIHNQVITNEVNEPTKEQDILAGIKKENPQVIIQDLAVDLGSSTATQTDIFVKNSTIYLPNDRITVYFNSSGKKILSNDLTETNIGDLHDNKPETILATVKNKNPKVDINQLEIINDSITNNGVLLTPKKDSQSYISGQQVQVYFRIYNPHIGTVKRKINEVFDSFAFIQTTDGRILASSAEFIYELNLDGTVKHKLSSHVDESIADMIQLLDGRIWILDIRGEIFELDLVNDTIKKLGFNITETPEAIIQLQNGMILLGGAKGNIYELNSDGTIKNKIVKLPNEYGINGLVKLKNGIILVVNGHQIYQVNLNGTFKLVVDQVDNFSFFHTIVELKDGTILAAGYWNKGNGGKIYQLNDDGSIKTEVGQNVLVAIPVSIFQTNTGTILMGTSNGIYELNNE